MAGKGSGVLSQTGKVRQIQKILDLSEAKLIQVLSGNTRLPERAVVNVALEIYKRRVPSKTEKAGNEGNSLTMIKVVKNFTPEGHDKPIEITSKSDQIEDLTTERVKEIKAATTEFFDDPIAEAFGEGAITEENPVGRVLAGEFSKDDDRIEKNKKIENNRAKPIKKRHI